MKHLISYSVYQEPTDLSADLENRLREIRCDGIELLTSHMPVDPCWKQYAVSVHLPFASDWMAAWNGEPYEMSDLHTKYYMYGRDREDILKTVRNIIDLAAPLKPAHGVMHACNISLRELGRHNYSGSCSEVITTFCEMMNEAVSAYPGGEPPFKLVFENLWWPGLRLQNDSEYRIMEKHLEFSNWGICLDTGHLMNTLPGIYTEQDGISALLKVFDGYPEDLIDRISAMHFHYSASGKYRETFEEQEYEGGPITDFIAKTYSHITTIDQHLPFSDPACGEIIDRIRPELVIHELPGHGHSPIDDYIQQRGLLS